MCAEIMPGAASSQPGGGARSEGSASLHVCVLEMRLPKRVLYIDASRLCLTFTVRRQEMTPLVGTLRYSTFPMKQSLLSEQLLEEDSLLLPYLYLQESVYCLGRSGLLCCIQITDLVREAHQNAGSLQSSSVSFEQRPY